MGHELGAALSWWLFDSPGVDWWCLVTVSRQLGVSWLTPLTGLEGHTRLRALFDSQEPQGSLCGLSHGSWTCHGGAQRPHDTVFDTGSCLGLNS